jgi:hypothetical protein
VEGVGIGEGQAEALGQQRAERRFAAARDAHDQEARRHQASVATRICVT